MTQDIARLRELSGREEAPRYLLVKRDLYYCPDNMGYTGVKDRAGRYHASEANPESGVTAIHEDDAPMFSKACWEDVKVKHLLAQLEAATARIGVLEEALSFYVSICGNTAYSVDREAAMHAYEKARAALARAKGPSHD